MVHFGACVSHMFWEMLRCWIFHVWMLMYCEETTQLFVYTVYWNTIITQYMLYVHGVTMFYTTDTSGQFKLKLHNYSDVIIGAMASQMTSLTIVYSTVYSGADQRTSKLCVTGLCAGNSPVTDEFPAQMASNAENVSIWWRHHYIFVCCQLQSSWVLLKMYSRETDRFM